MLRAEDPAELQGGGLRPLIIPLPELPGDLPRQAGGEGDEPLVMGPEQRQIHPGLDVKAPEEGLGDHIAEVFVPRFVFAQQHQVPGFIVQPVLPVLHPPGSHVDLAADHRMDARRYGGLIEGHGPVHHPVVRHRDGGLTQVPDPLHQPLDAAGSVQQAVFAVYMQMGKGHGVLLQMRTFVLYYYTAFPPFLQGKIPAGWSQIGPAPLGSDLRRLHSAPRTRFARTVRSVSGILGRK